MLVWFPFTPSLEPSRLPGGASVIVAMTMGEGNALSAQGPGGTAGREDYPALAPTPLGEKAFLHRREEGGGSSDPRLTLRGSGGPACVSRAPSPGAAAGRAWQMDLPPAPALGKHIRRRFLLPGQAELTFPGTGGAGCPPPQPAPTPLMGSQRRESQMDVGPAVSARSMLGFPPFPLSFYREQDQPGKDLQTLPEGGKGRSQSFSHNSKTRHALKTRTSFPSLPLTHLVAKPDLTRQETVNGRWDPALTPGVATLDLSLP